MKLAAEERETIINFNEADKEASVFTYNKRWQQHFEKKLGLKPMRTNSFGGREYEIDKKRISMPRAPRKLSADAKKRIGQRLAEARQQKSHLSSRNIVITKKSASKKSGQ